MYDTDSFYYFVYTYYGYSIAMRSLLPLISPVNHINLVKFIITQIFISQVLLPGFLLPEYLLHKFLKLKFFHFPSFLLPKFFITQFLIIHFNCPSSSGYTDISPPEIYPTLWYVKETQEFCRAGGT